MILSTMLFRGFDTRMRSLELLITELMLEIFLLVKGFKLSVFIKPT